MVADHKKVNITCVVDGVHPVPGIVWLVNGVQRSKATRLSSQSINGKFQVESRIKLTIGQEPDRLDVMCLVTNPANSSDVWDSKATQADVYCRFFTMAQSCKITLCCALYILFIFLCSNFVSLDILFVSQETWLNSPIIRT